MGSKPRETGQRNSGAWIISTTLTLEGKIGDLETLVRAPGRRYDGSVADKGVVDTRVGDEVGLELVQIDVEGTVEAEGGRDGADDLRDQTVKVLVGRPGDIEVAAADVIDSLVVDQECTIRVLDGAMGREDGVVGLDNGVGNARGGVDAEL